MTPGQLKSACALALTCAVGLAGGAVAAEAPTSGPPPLERDGTLSAGANPRAYLNAPGDKLRLSNEKTVTRWSTTFRRSPIRRKPRDSAGQIAKLTFVSGSRTAEIYGLLQAVVDRQNRTWVQVRVPGRPNGRVGWTLMSALNRPSTVTTRLVVDRRKLRATFFRDGRKIFKAPVGVGKPSTPTPGGRYYMDRKEGAIFGATYGSNVLFSNAFTEALPDWPGGGAIGIHGTSQPELIPGRPSSGCIRLVNRDIERLTRIMPVGTPLRIR